MAETDMAQFLDRHDKLDRLAQQRKHPAQTGVEQQRLVIGNEKLIERKTGWKFVTRLDRRRNTVDPVGDFIDPGSGLLIGNWHYFLPFGAANK